MLIRTLRNHNSEHRDIRESRLRGQQRGHGLIQIHVGNSYFHSVRDKSLNTWKTRKFKQCVFLSFHSGNFSFVIHFSPTSPWSLSLGTHMGYGKGKMHHLNREKNNNLWSGPHAQKESRSSNCKFQFSWKKRPQICKSLLRVLRWIRLSSLPL